MRCPLHAPSEHYHHDVPFNPVMESCTVVLATVSSEPFFFFCCETPREDEAVVAVVVMPAFGLFGGTAGSNLFVMEDFTLLGLPEHVSNEGGLGLRELFALLGVTCEHVLVDEVPDFSYEHITLVEDAELIGHTRECIEHLYEGGVAMRKGEVLPAPVIGMKGVVKLAVLMGSSNRDAASDA